MKRLVGLAGLLVLVATAGLAQEEKAGILTAVWDEPFEPVSYPGMSGGVLEAPDLWSPVSVIRGTSWLPDPEDRRLQWLRLAEPAALWDLEEEAYHLVLQLAAGGWSTFEPGWLPAGTTVRLGDALEWWGVGGGPLDPADSVGWAAAPRFSFAADLGAGRYGFMWSGSPEALEAFFDRTYEMFWSRSYTGQSFQVALDTGSEDVYYTSLVAPEPVPVVSFGPSGAVEVEAVGSWKLHHGDGTPQEVYLRELLLREGPPAETAQVMLRLSPVPRGTRPVDPGLGCQLRLAVHDLDIADGLVDDDGKPLVWTDLESVGGGSFEGPLSGAVDVFWDRIRSAGWYEEDEGFYVELWPYGPSAQAPGQE